MTNRQRAAHLNMPNENSQHDESRGPSGPALIAPSDFREFAGTSDGGLKVGVAVDGESHGSLLVFGLEWIEPNTEVAIWTADPSTYEAYYVQSGRIRVSWSGGSDGEAEVNAGQCFYFAPGHKYSLENASDEAAFIIFAITPAMPEGEN